MWHCDFKNVEHAAYRAAGFALVADLLGGSVGTVATVCIGDWFEDCGSAHKYWLYGEYVDYTRDVFRHVRIRINGEPIGGEMLSEKQQTLADLVLAEACAATQEIAQECGILGHEPVSVGHDGYHILESYRSSAPYDHDQLLREIDLAHVLVKNWLRSNWPAVESLAKRVLQSGSGLKWDLRSEYGSTKRDSGDSIVLSIEGSRSRVAANLERPNADLVDAVVSDGN